MDEILNNETINILPDGTQEAMNKITLSSEDLKRLTAFATGPEDGILDADLTEKLRLIYLTGQKTDIYSPETGILKIDTGMRISVYPVRANLDLARAFGKTNRADAGGHE